MQEKTVSIYNLKVKFKVAGQGPVILILHGWGASSASWSKVQRILAKNGYEVICPDFPGFGKSETSQEPWSITDYMKWVNAFVESQDLNRFSLLGHSFGGRVAIKFAASFPEKIKTLILCNSAGIKVKLDPKRKLASFLAGIAKSLPVEIRNKVSDTFLNDTDYVRAKGVMKQTIKNVIAEDLLPYLSEIRAKTLIVWGEKDEMVPISNAYIFKENIAGSELQIIPDAGHSPHLEKPKILSEIISEFFS
ncbi:MAG: alpha/beta hydrolase [Patescibacteria group bacterium]|nr:alpha/beta hydrolase [Patescibacteria group bacterium]